MRATEIIRNLLDILDQVEDQQEQPIAVGVDVVVAQTAEPTAEYQNVPHEMVSPLGAAFPSGTDLNKSKNPADIRTNAPSMFPDFQARQ